MAKKEESLIDKMLAPIKGMFDALPFDGDKTKLSAWLVVLGGLSQAFPHAAFLTWLNVNLPGLMETGFAGALIGLLHKALKFMYPEKK